MNRRTLLAIGSASVATGLGGCIDRSDGTANGDDSNEDDFASAVEAQQAEYESDAEPLPFEANPVESFEHTHDGDIPLIPGGLGSDDADPLTCISGCRDVDRTTVYGFVLPSEETATQLNEELVSRSFIDDTDFETQSLLLLQHGQPQISTGFEITFIGELVDEEAVYLAFRSMMGGGEEPAFISRLLRIDRQIPDTLLVGQAHKFDVKEDAQFNYAIYTNDPQALQNGT